MNLIDPIAQVTFPPPIYPHTTVQRQQILAQQLFSWKLQEKKVTTSWVVISVKKSQQHKNPHKN